MKNAAVVLFLLALVCSCGGGGGTGTSEPLIPDLQTAKDLTEQILNDCVYQDIQQFLDLQEMFVGMVDPDTGDLTGLEFTGVGPNWSILWALDPDEDGEPEVTGSLRFEDAQGQPMLPFNPLDPPADATELAAILSGLPDGTVLIFDYLMPGDPGDASIDGTLSFVWMGGAPSTTSGTATITSDVCIVVLSWNDVDASAFAGDYPTVVMDLEVYSDLGNLDGTITFDGTNVALVETEIGGQYTTRYYLDLETGLLTPAP